jgi:hypothetical protein
MLTTTWCQPGVSRGATTFTCINPASPGASPANVTVTGTPPIRTSTGASGDAKGASGPGSPVDTAGVDAPCPVTHTVR